MRLDFYFTGSREPDPPPPQTSLPPVRQRFQPSLIPVTTAGGFHLFPFRTQQLSLPAPMVLSPSGMGEWVVAGMMLRSKPGSHGSRALALLDASADAGLPYPARARSSVGEHYLDMVGVAGSIPAAPIVSLVARPPA